MLTAVDPTEIKEEQTSLTKVLLTDLPSEDEAEDVDYTEMESEEQQEEEDDEEEEEEKEDIDPEEVQDIVMGHMSLQNTMALRGGKELSQAYRDSTIMQEFASDEDDEEYQDEEISSDEEDSEEEEMDEQDDELDTEEVKDTLLNSAQVVGEKDELLINKNKVLRHGKEIQSGEVGDLTDQIKQFSNLCGSVYTRGNLVFTPDGNKLLSPVGNKISEFDLVNNASSTFPFETRHNINNLSLSPNGTLLLAIDINGKCLLINYHRKVVLHHHSFKGVVSDVKFSPNGKMIAVAIGSHIQLWKCPGFTLDYSPFILLKELPGHYDTINSLSWSYDSEFLLSSSKDMTARLYPIVHQQDFPGALLSGHRDDVLGAWFSKDMKYIFSVSKDGALFSWTFDKEKLAVVQEKDIDRSKTRKGGKGQKIFIQTWKSLDKHYFEQNHAKVTSVAFHAESGLLSCGFSSGIFGIWELPDFINIHTLSISQKKITSVTINSTGEWLAFGCSKFGQLLVWEWQSESFILKQQGHRNDMHCLAYSADGQYVATGGDDGKIKLWNMSSGFCFVTFADHESAITAIDFVKSRQVLFSASLDGTVRAYDLVRYRNFRTFTSPKPVQFNCLAVEASGEVVCAGSQDTFEIFMWSVQTGHLLDIFAGHEGPISSLSFSPVDGILASGSWDKTIKVWEVFKRDSTPETFDQGAEVLTLAYRPDGKSLAATTLKGQVAFWDLNLGKQVASIEGSKDISGGRQSHEIITAANSTRSKHFTSICFTADGSAIIAGGNSKYICIYDVRSQQLLKKFQISHNLSLDGMHEMLDSRNMTEAGPKDLLDTIDDESDFEDRMDHYLPGAQSGDMSLRKTRPTARTTCVKFSPTGRSWAAASTEGLLIYALDPHITFDPFELELEITPDAVQEALQEQAFLKSMIMAFRIGEKKLIESVYELIPVSEIELIAREIPKRYVPKLVSFIAEHLEKSPRIEYHLLWCTHIMNHCGIYLRENNTELAAILRGLQKGLQMKYDDLSKLCDRNTFSLEYILEKMDLSMEKGALESF